MVRSPAPEPPGAAGAAEQQEKRYAVSGNAGLIYNINRYSILAFNAGRAFRMPDASDMFTERATCSGVLSPNPALRPEYSWN
ncbi:MAG: TonB-dependent receptor, partial [Opitutae bacterium]|nr:TonB-dependent receptor [Opitutae bacterium]